MSVPKSRQTSGRSKRRRSHHALKEPNVQYCPNCKKPKASHRACSHCGYYDGMKKVALKKAKKKSS